ncbi:MAG: methyl-accepting chemotaxis protein [Desulfobulbaceae bacterium]|nr:methyl-accepting chemotaxis protein [Desulfobulbaceae bacterium]
MSISLKLKLTALAFTGIIVLMFLATLYATSRQKNDGLIINLAGRQRMLSQKMSKELHHFMYVTDKQGKPDVKSADMVQSTMDIFKMTLTALTKSGKAPLSLNLKETKYRVCPAAKEPALSQLAIVKTTWDNLSSVVLNILNGTYTSNDLDLVHRQNIVLLKEMDKAVSMMQKQAEGSVNWLLTIQIIAIVLGGCAASYAFVIVRSITNRLKMVNNFSELFGQGNLTVLSGVSGSDELGQIGTSLDSMAGNLREIIGNISSNATHLNNTSGQLLNIADQVSGGSESVSARSQSVASAAEEMSCNMSSVAAAVEETSSNVSIMSGSVREMANTINRITNDTDQARSITSNAVSQSQTASERVNELGTSAKEIGKVTEAITEISEQTNLLALNATIEAARAGEAGKGFAVVANEIKDLAKQTAEATLDIRSNIESIQSSTSVTVTEINGIADIVNKVDRIVSSIASALEEQTAATAEITENVSQASEGIMEVTENVAQSSVVAGEVANDIAGVHEESGQMASSSTEVKERAKGLNELASELSRVVEKFSV